MKLPGLLFLITITAQAQYIDVSADANKLSGLIDNPRTKEDYKGFDVDLEIGARTNNLGVYTFWGIFDAADYMNYGAGADYYFMESEFEVLGADLKFEASAGAGVSIIMRRVYWQDHFQGWLTLFAWHSRVNGIVWITQGIGFSVRLQYQRRPGIKCRGIFEGSAGIRIKI